MDNIAKYFDGEKLQCIIGIIISIVCISISVYFLFLQKAMVKGLAYSFIPLSVLLLIICAGVVIRTPKDIARVTGFYQEKSQKLRTDEVPRMERVMNSFGIIKKVEILFFIAGLLMAIFFRHNDLVKGIAIGLMIQGAILYLFDHIAESRGKIYLEFLRSL